MIEYILNDNICKGELNQSGRIKNKSESSLGVNFHIENKWEGVVLNVDSGIIYSKMKDVLSEDDYEFDFKISDVEKDDRALVEPGALFNFYIGYTVNGRTRKSNKIIKFRRQITSQNTVNSILEKMKELNLSSLIEIQ